MFEPRQLRTKVNSISSLIPRVIVLLAMALILAGQTGCSRSLRKDGTQVAKIGSATSKQMGEYYESLQKDLTDTYELEAFGIAYSLQKAYDKDVAKAKAENLPPPTPPPTALDETDKRTADEYRKTYSALQKRIAVAHAMQDAYDSFQHITEYNATAEVNKSIGSLKDSLDAVKIGDLSAIDPRTPVGTIGKGVFEDVIRELTTVQSNRAILRESEHLAAVLEKIQDVFQSELILYGGDQMVKDSSGHEVPITGITGARSRAYRRVVKELVDSDAIITTSLVSRVLGAYDFKWPEPQVPFTQPAMKAGILKMIEARSFPIVQLSVDTGDKLSNSLKKLAVLHHQLAANRPLSLQEAAQQSETVQVLIDQLKKKNVPVDFFKELILTLQKGV